MSSQFVFLHGWAQSKLIWCRQMQAFPNAVFLNLPGHGGTENSEDWVDAIAEVLPDRPSTIVGWSLGGMLAMQIAERFPERVKRLVLVATTPRFRSGAGWDSGCSEEVFQGFSAGVNSHAAKTLNRFFAMMFQGDDLERSQYNSLAREAVDRDNPPSLEALQKGLEYLDQLDLINAVPFIRQPALVLHGESDVIVPEAAGAWLAASLPTAEYHRLEHCGHVPFLTKSDQFNQLLEAWCHRN